MTSARQSGIVYCFRKGPSLLRDRASSFMCVCVCVPFRVGGKDAPLVVGNRVSGHSNIILHRDIDCGTSCAAAAAVCRHSILVSTPTSTMSPVSCESINRRCDV